MEHTYYIVVADEDPGAKCYAVDAENQADAFERVGFHLRKIGRDWYHDMIIFWDEPLDGWGVEVQKL